MKTQYLLGLLALCLAAVPVAAVTLETGFNGTALILTGGNQTPDTFLVGDDDAYFNVSSSGATVQVLTNPRMESNVTDWTGGFEDNAPATNTWAYNTTRFTSSPGSGRLEITPSNAQDNVLMSGTASQTLTGVDNTTQNTLNWSMKFERLTNPANSQWAAMCAEVVGTINGTANRRLYYCTIEDGALPANTTEVKYLAVGGAGTGWQNFSRDVGADIQSAFGTGSYNLTDVRLVARMLTGNIPNTPGSPVFTIHFDDAYLTRRAFRLNLTAYSPANLTVPGTHQVAYVEAVWGVKSNSTLPVFSGTWQYNGTRSTYGCTSRSLNATEQVLNCSDEAYPSGALTASQMESGVWTGFSTSNFQASLDYVRFRAVYPNLTQATLTPEGNASTPGYFARFVCNGSTDADWRVRNATATLYWDQGAGVFVPLNTTPGAYPYLSAATPNNPGVPIAANSSNGTLFLVTTNQSGPFTLKCQVASPEAGRVNSSPAGLYIINETYYEHNATPSTTFSLERPSNTTKTFTLNIPRASGENVFLDFDRDVIETGNGSLLPVQTVGFSGWFNSSTLHGLVNWRLVDYDPVNATETELCRTPQANNGQRIRSGEPERLTATCELTSTYHILPGHRLRVKIYVYNDHPVQDDLVTHLWDNETYDSGYQLSLIYQPITFVPNVTTGQPSYPVCQAIFYKFDFTDINNTPTDAPATVRLIDVFGTVNATQLLSSTNGSLYGYFNVPPRPPTGEWFIDVTAGGASLAQPFLMGYGDNSIWRADIQFSPSKIRYTTLEPFDALITVWNQQGLALPSLWPSQVSFGIDGGPVTNATDLGNGTYVFRVNPALMAVNQTHRVSALTINGTGLAERTFYVVAG